MMFSETVPLNETTQFIPTDVRDSEADATGSTGPASLGFPSTLSPSLLSDLKRFGDEPARLELLPTLAASVRHGRALALHVQHGRDTLRLSVFPREQLFHCSVNLCALPAAALSQLTLLHVEPEGTLAPFWADGSPASSLQFAALAPLLWLLAEHGGHGELLPEIAGSVRYRLAPGLSMHGLPVDRADMPLLQRLRTTASSLDELARWSVLGPARVRRLLNALYLQSGLMISRAFPVFGRSGGARP